MFEPTHKTKFLFLSGIFIPLSVSNSLELSLNIPPQDETAFQAIVLRL